MKSSTVAAPNVSSSVSVRFGIARIAPLGRSRSRRYMFSGDVNMCRSIVIGNTKRNVRNAATWTHHSTWCHVSSVDGAAESTSAESGYPMNDHFSNAGRPSSAIRTISVANPVIASTKNIPRMTACSGFVLMRMRYGRCT